MPRVKCASIDCKWNNDNSMCSYKGILLLNDSYYHTTNEGRQHFHNCKMYEKSESAKLIEENFTSWMKEKGFK